jgi:hypothetical protein
MLQSLKEYIPAVVRSCWAMIGLPVGALGIISGVLGNTILLPYWAWVIIGIVALIVAQFLAYHKVREQRDGVRNEVASVISELESDIISLGGQSINIARLFWRLGQRFLEGMFPNSISSSIGTIFQEANADECNKAEQNLMSELRLSQLIHDEQRQHMKTGYTLTIATPLGISVIKELKTRWGDSPWPPSTSEQVSNKEGSQT